ncbi:MAG: hypothetical protein IIB71_08830 [Proteobacteria bacterium]|nr:hypothetical protein [Pseudomonadota bacterium]
MAGLITRKKPFGLGYYDGPGNTLSHFIWGEAKEEYGPYIITWKAYQTKDQLQGEETLLQSLDDSLRMPMPHFGWDF